MSSVGGGRALHVRAPPRARICSSLAGGGGGTDSAAPVAGGDAAMDGGEPAAVAAAFRPPPDPELVAASRLSMEELNETDMATLVRQLGYRPTPLGVGARCRHGFPQAFVWDPLTQQEAARKEMRKDMRMPVTSGLFRLTCPLLVKAIDEWEAEGAVVELNMEVNIDRDEKEGTGLETMHDDLVEVNTRHAQARRALVGERVYESMRNDPAGVTVEPKRKRSGAPAATVAPTREALAELLLDSGVAGMSPNKAEVKCLHAQVADHLCRSRSNPVAQRILEGLVDRGVAVDGDDVCRQQCDSSIAKDDARFWYVPAKNKAKLFTIYERRKEHKERVLLARAKCGARGVYEEAVAGAEKPKPATEPPAAAQRLPGGDMG